MISRWWHNDDPVRCLEGLKKHSRARAISFMLFVVLSYLLLWAHLHHRVDGSPSPLSREQLSFFVDKLGPDREPLVALMRSLARIFEQFQIEYLVFAGTAISYCRHGGTLMPFDDDTDVLISANSIPRLQLAVKQHNDNGPGKYGFLAMRSDQPSNRTGDVYKIFWSGTSSAGTTDWNYPFIDLWAYRNASGHEEGVPRALLRRTAGNRPWPGTLIYLKQHSARKSKNGGDENYPDEYVYPYELMFPTQNVWIEGIRMSAPRELGAYLEWEYGDGWSARCVLGTWDHRRERSIAEWPAHVRRTAPCEDVARLHPEWNFTYGQAANERCPTTPLGKILLASLM